MCGAMCHIPIMDALFTRWREHLEIPAEALREALTNALCHRQYERYNLFVSIAIYDDRVEIDNPGRLPRELTVESILLPHKSFPYNLLMAKVLYMSAFLESWGSGVKRMMNLCTADGLHEPEFVQDGSFVMIRFWRKRHENEPQNEPQRMRRAKLLELIDGDNSISKETLCKKLDVQISTVKRDMKALGIVWEGPSKTGHWMKVE